MNYRFLIGVFLLFAVFEQTSAEVGNQAQHVSVVAKYFRPWIRQLSRPVDVYHWNGTGLGGEDPLLLQWVQGAATTFWNTYRSQVNQGSSMYGNGLYAAVDPVATFGFSGGVPQGMSLVRMRLPENARILDLSTGVVENKNNNQVLEILLKYQCPNAMPEFLFKEGGRDLKASCRELIYKVFSQALRVDALAYDYVRSKFSYCTRSEWSEGGAFVIMSNHWMTPESVHIFNSESRFATEERLRIQTLFLQDQKTMIPDFGNGKNIILEFLRNHPDHELVQSESRCEGKDCQVSVQFCTQAPTQEHPCESILVGTFPRPGGPLITSEEAARSGARWLLWSDLEGQAKSPEIHRWAKDNLFGCSDKFPYQGYSNQESSGPLKSVNSGRQELNHEK